MFSDSNTTCTNIYIPKYKTESVNIYQTSHSNLYYLTKYGKKKVDMVNFILKSNIDNININNDTYHHNNEIVKLLIYIYKCKLPINWNNVHLDKDQIDLVISRSLLKTSIDLARKFLTSDSEKHEYIKKDLDKIFAVLNDFDNKLQNSSYKINYKIIENENKENISPPPRERRQPQPPFISNELFLPTGPSPISPEDLEKIKAFASENYKNKSLSKSPESQPLSSNPNTNTFPPPPEGYPNPNPNTNTFPPPEGYPNPNTNTFPPRPGIPSTSGSRRVSPPSVPPPERLLSFPPERLSFKNNKKGTGGKLNIYSRRFLSNRKIKIKNKKSFTKRHYKNKKISTKRRYTNKKSYTKK
jgi:hypothetical protein